MTKTDVDELLMAINALVDNCQDWSRDAIRTQSQAVQEMAANLPNLVRERDELRRRTPRCTDLLDELAGD